MAWNRLLPRARVNHRSGIREIDSEQARSAFERDWDRIIFSTAFRRMHDKTQLFPLPDDDVVHSRLTHSLEVSSVGRSLGKRAGQTICRRHLISKELFDDHDVGMVVAVACLAHDIGNPPFGHAGENAIASYFQGERAPRELNSLTPQQLADLRNFEGNAQGFRILTRLQLEADKGLRLTAATLAAFCKYPRVSGEGLADGPVVARLAAGDRRDGRSIQHGSPRPVDRGRPSPGRVGHPDGDRQRVGRIVRPGQLGHPEDQLDHPLDLLLVGRPVARDRALDLVRRGLVDGRPVLGRRQEDDGRSGDPADRAGRAQHHPALRSS
jgi:hypothetical protein